MCLKWKATEKQTKALALPKSQSLTWWVCGLTWYKKKLEKELYIHNWRKQYDTAEIFRLITWTIQYKKQSIECFGEEKGKITDELTNSYRRK
jgi:hypothetical protein